MPKLKTNKGVAKRLRFTKSGKLKKRNAGRQHILGKKSRKRKRQLRRIIARLINGIDHIICHIDSGDD